MENNNFRKEEQGFPQTSALWSKKLYLIIFKLFVLKYN